MSYLFFCYFSSNIRNYLKVFNEKSYYYDLKNNPNTRVLIFIEKHCFSNNGIMGIF